jgi:uncharacterized membrane protein YbhN (UPF0104 family)
MIALPMDGGRARQRMHPVMEPPPQRPSSGNRRIHTVLAFAVTAVILALMLAPLSWEALVEAVKAIGPAPVLVVAVVALIDGLPVEVDKFRRTCRHVGIPLTFRNSAALSLPATALSAVFPAQAEEFVKARQLSLLHGVGLEQAVGTVILDRGYNLGSHLVLLAGSLGAMAVGTTGPRALAAGLAAAGTAWGIGILMVSLVARWSGRISSRRGRALVQALRTASPRFNAGMVLYCGLAQIALAGALFFLTTSAGLAVPFAVVLAWRTGATLFAKLPVSIGGFGLREGALALGFASFGAAPTVVAASLLFGAVSVLVPSLAALAFYPLLARTLGYLQDDLVRAGRHLTDWWRAR